jgi:hypothetical protein
MSKIVIANLTTKEIQTVRGAAKVLHFRNAENNLWYDSFAGTWNSDWCDGLELDVAADQVRSRIKGDFEYLTIAPPAKGGGRPPAPAPRGVTDTEVVTMLKGIVRDLAEIKVLLGARMEEAERPEPDPAPSEKSESPPARREAIEEGLTEKDFADLANEAPLKPEMNAVPVKITDSDVPF